MAIEKILTYDTELNEDIGYTVHPISLALGESNGHTIKVNVLRGGTKVTDSATCKGKFLRADGSTVEFNGTFSSGIASVTLPSSCYTKEGACKLSVYLVSGSQISCVFVLVANVLKYTSTEIVDTNQVVPNIETLLANVAKIEAIANDADAINKKVGHVEKSGNTIMFYSDNTKSRLIASVDIPAGSGGGTAAPYDDTYLRNNKVGYAEFENGVLKMYNDATKSNLIRQVTIHTGSGGGITDDQVQDLIDDSLIPVNAGLSELESKKIGHVEKTTNGNSTTTSYYDSPQKEHLILTINETNPIGSDFTSAQKEALKKVANVATMPTDDVESAGKVWGTTSNGAGWVDAPSGGTGDGSGASINERNTLVDLLESVLFKDENILTKWNDFKNAWGDGTGTDGPVTPPSGDDDDPVTPPVDPPSGDDDESIINGFIAKTIPRNTVALDRDYPNNYQTEYNDEDYVYIIHKGTVSGMSLPSEINTPFCTGWVREKIVVNNEAKETIWSYPSVQTASNYPHWYCVKIDISKYNTWYETHEAITVGGKYILYQFNSNNIAGVYGYDSSLSVENANTYLLKEEPTLEEFLIMKGDAINDL